MEDTIISDFNNQQIIIHLFNAPQERNIPPEKLMDDVYNYKKYRRWYASDLDYLKQDNPTIPKDDLECLAVELTLNEILGPSGYEQVVQSVASTQPKLSKTEAQTMYVLMALLHKKPEYLMSYIYDNGIFPGLLFKDSNTLNPDSLSVLNETLKQNPCWPVELVMACLNKTQLYPDILTAKLDKWLAYHLNNVNFKRQANNSRFTEDLGSYLRYGPKNENAVCCLVCSKMQNLRESDQALFWEQILSENTDEQKRCQAVQAFLESPHSEASNKVFMDQVHTHICPQEFDEILGQASDEVKKNYFSLLKNQKQDLTQVKICNPQTKEQNFLVWDLYSRGKILNTDVITLIQNHALEKRENPAKKSFLFQDKKSFDWGVFSAGCQKMKSSPIRALMWISSFEKLPEFASSLAYGWESLPVEMRQNKNIQLSCDNRFDLFYQLARRGNTSMLNEIMKTMKDEYPEFIRRLTRKHKDGDTCLHQLCRQGKKGVLKLLDQLSKSEQQSLLEQKNFSGQSVSDVCSSDFRRFLDQRNFIRPVCEASKEEKVDKVLSPEPSPEASVQSKPAAKKLIWRPQFKSTRFTDDCEKFQNQPNVLKGANREIAKLRSMSWTDLQLRMGQDIKRSFKSRLCAADFSADGNAYRMGYILQDGVIGVLFIMTHQQYNTELQCKGPLDTVAQNVRKQISAQAAQYKQGGRH